MRPRKTDRYLPACMYQRGPSFYFVRQGKWENLGKDYVQALLEYARLTSPKASTAGLTPYRAGKYINVAFSLAHAFLQTIKSPAHSWAFS